MVTDTIKKVANAILDAGEGCQSGLVYVDPVEAAKAAIAALSTDAEPVAYLRPCTITMMRSQFESLTLSDKDHPKSFPVYADPPAPSVAVKALRWSEPHPSTTYPEWRAFGLAFEAVIDKSKPLHFGKFPLRINGRHTDEKFETLEAAKSFAQADYEARIRSALSAAPAAKQEEKP